MCRCNKAHLGISQHRTHRQIHAATALDDGRARHAAVPWASFTHTDLRRCNQPRANQQQDATDKLKMPRKCQIALLLQLYTACSSCEAPIQAQACRQKPNIEVCFNIEI